MITTETTQNVSPGGAFLISETTTDRIFTPEELTDEQHLFAESTREFAEQYIYPNLDRIDEHEAGLVESLLDKTAEIGLLGAAVPEAYGGLGVDIKTETAYTEIIGSTHAFSVSFLAHTGIGTLPILYFGTETQKQKYLPKLASGELKAAYCLTEPGSGSDALAARTKATLSADGTYYLLEGQKMWITNAGFADILTVFAQIDGDKFTGFIVDAHSPNIRLGNEEHKMGIKGSSTRQVFFEGVKVPVENVLGEIGQGHKIAFNVLNIGRYKLAIAVTGGAKASITKAVQYANEREQFDKPIAKFGAIRHKIAEMAVRTFALESANYRTAGLLYDFIEHEAKKGTNPTEAKLHAAEEYAIECALLKVFGSEVLDYCVDELVQVLGGNGFSEEYPAARAYRDSRINRIFEGTNEINRLLTIDMYLKRAMRGSIDLFTPGMAIQKELMSVPEFGDDGDASFILAAEKKAIKQAKKAALMVAGSAAQKYLQRLATEQEIMMSATDMLIDIFAAESALLRVEKMIGIKGETACATYIDVVKVFVSDAMERIHLNGKHALLRFAEGDEQRVMLMGLKRFTKLPAFDTISARRRIADVLIEANRYCL
ncbi:MAG: acyl-CoA dehydrogenase family protein [Sphingobacteriales bacterium]|jgi:alkylation response protein AidB-like acyl-CoA dehydrogenase|nr:acyl-CoA dehydrogenase family protein [Sphingobacteriales bacterium]MBP9141499.1 acyl-CoA dehydrogenase family protein [Chitinophagales bacterium]MDA0199230.1 acyl-CoA dehydrogenase family protein [Bacteroidota bacterium]MBK6889185.1 acyl-CoA dehydrogenase family protein [Sphingobacteriales bacterium]MBK7528311.1 acyl-CoA dehydrogenase family protein [Sphingobacteriales bacterium]